MKKKETHEGKSNWDKQLENKKNQRAYKLRKNKQSKKYTCVNLRNPWKDTKILRYNNLYVIVIHTIWWEKSMLKPLTWARGLEIAEEFV